MVKDTTARAAGRADVDALIETLAADLRPTPAHALPGRLAVVAGWGAAIALLSLAAATGRRLGPMGPGETMATLVKVGYALAVGAPALCAAARLARPEGRGGAWFAWIAAPLVLLAAAALGGWVQAPAAARAGLLWGETALACPAWIVAASAPALAGLIVAMRSQATTRPALTGALLGLVAGAAGAVAYAAFCQERSLGFIALRYTSGLAGAAALGALVGAWRLRW